MSLSKNVQRFFMVLIGLAVLTSCDKKIMNDTIVIKPPELVSPENETFSYTNQPVFIWEAAEGAVSYALQIDVSEEFNELVISSTDITDTEYQIAEKLADGEYFWRVKAAGSGGEMSEWSDVWRFTVQMIFGTAADIDGNIYHTIQIGKQRWMTENLKVTHYSNGEPVPFNSQYSDIPGQANGSYYIYDDNEENADIYGYLYNWWAVADSRNIAPEGWRVPTDEDWKQLEMELGMNEAYANEEGWRGTDEGYRLKAAFGWAGGGNGNNESLFSALPGGYRIQDDGTFEGLEHSAYFWTATELHAFGAWYRYLSFARSDIYRMDVNKRRGFTVRLVQDIDGED